MENKKELSFGKVADDFNRQPDNLYFRNACKQLCDIAGVSTAAITQCVDFTHDKVRALAFYHDNKFIDTVEYELENTPCKQIIQGENCFYRADIQKLFPLDHDLVDLNAESYCAVPLKNSYQEVLGHIFIIDDKPLDDDKEKYFSIINSFSSPIAKELERQQNEIIFSDFLEAFSIQQGDDFFDQITCYIQNFLKVDYILIAEKKKEKTIKTLSVCYQGEIQEGIEYPAAGTPCGKVFNKLVCSYESNVQGFYPGADILKQLKAESYIGVPLLDV